MRLAFVFFVSLGRLLPAQATLTFCVSNQSGQPFVAYVFAPGQFCASQQLSPGYWLCWGLPDHISSGVIWAEGSNRGCVGPPGGAALAEFSCNGDCYYDVSYVAGHNYNVDICPGSSSAMLASAVGAVNKTGVPGNLAMQPAYNYTGIATQPCACGSNCPFYDPNCSSGCGCVFHCSDSTYNVKIW
ncbi:hypothetical protein AAVH_11051 [Aphelenchoides avenae]|nr:hypothetical protein AAVH_11051 [Aphelenchus avenae]